MSAPTDPAAAARAIIDANLYLVLATADANGRPWASPVYFAPDGYRSFVWVSRPEARHSRNLTARPEVGIVVFDSSVPIGTGRGVYVSAEATELAGDERSAAIEIFSRRSLAHGGNAWTIDDVQPPAALRLFRADASEQYVLEAGDRRAPVTL
jgi:nitroimidazol reductase NimA-like FMN-containing flavoprotein (pyridoxamine 5'-phosphate oxidase superfamily)